MPHECIHETRMLEMHEMLKRLDEGLRGNGKPGLFTQFAVWKNTVAGLVALNVIIVGTIVAMWFKS
jgi:hypothetical protein